jgi:hypothetical protein
MKSRERSSEGYDALLLLQQQEPILVAVAGAIDLNRFVRE